MEPSMSPSRQPGEDISLEAVRAAKEDLKKILEERGIKVALGIGWTAEGKYAIAVRISPDHGLSEEQIQEIKAMKTHNKVPLDVVITGRISRR